METKAYSKTVLGLKFMTRTRMKVDEKKEEDEQKALYAKQLASIDRKEQKIIYLPSYSQVKSYLPCHLSFGGFEPDIDKINEGKLTGIYAPLKKEVKEEKEVVKDMEADVDEYEMSKKIYSKRKNIKNGGKHKFTKKLKVENDCNEQDDE